MSPGVVTKTLPGAVVAVASVGLGDRLRSLKSSPRVCPLSPARPPRFFLRPDGIICECSSG